MNKKRLLKLADFLDTVPRRSFDIGLYAKHTPRCGTMACAIGYAGLMTCFRRAGLKTAVYLNETTYGQHKNLAAAEGFFGLNEYESMELFMGAFYDQKNVTPKMVARKIRKLVESKGIAT